MRDIESQSAEHLPAELAQVFNTARRGVLRRAGLLGLLASGAFYGGPAAFGVLLPGGRFRGAGRPWRRPREASPKAPRPP
ncbi:MAG: hypothetical protein ACO3CJ_07590 [Burkholderiaceae bacterium]